MKKGLEKATNYSIWIGKIIAAALIVFFIWAQPGQAASVQGMDSRGQGLQIYVIPNGEKGEQNGSFWIYAEMLDGDGIPYIEEGWTVNMQIHHLETDEIKETQDVQLSSENDGYLLSGVLLLSEHEYKDYELTVSIRNGEETVAEKKVLVSDALVQWPRLVESQWTQELGSKEKTEGLSRSVSFDWTDQKLFSRLFHVTLEKEPEKIDIQEIQDENIWALTPREPVEEELIFQLTDEVGNQQTYTFSVNITRTGWPLALKIMIVLLAVVLAVLVGVILFRKRLEKKTPPKQGKKTAPSGEDASLTEMKTEIINNKNELDKVRDQCEEEKTKYYQALTDKREVLNGQEEENEFKEDLWKIRERREDNSTEKNKEFDKKYIAAMEKLNYYGSHYDEWQRAEEREKEEFEEIVRCFGDEIDSIKSEKREFERKYRHLMQYLKKWNKKQEELNKKLNMNVFIEITKSDAVYKLNGEKNSDTGIVLDERRPLNRTHDLMDRTLSEILGERTGIRISAGSDESILLECLGEGLSCNGKMVKSREIPEGEILEFLYRFSDGSEARIEIETD